MSRPHGTFNLHGAEKRKKIKDPLRGIYQEEKKMVRKHTKGKVMAGCKCWGCKNIRALKEIK